MEYSYSFQDNIVSSAFNSTSRNVLNWIKENRDRFDWAKDPNAYEMANLFLFGAKYSSENKNIDINSLSQMWNIRSQDFGRCNISPNSFVFAICQDAYQAAVDSKPLVNDENSHHALRKMAGLGLFLKQQQRDTGEIAYNNPQELLQLLKCSMSLKTFHPELFNKYGFADNLNVLCNLQFQNQLPNEIAQSIHEAQNQLQSSIQNTGSYKENQNSEMEL